MSSVHKAHEEAWSSPNCRASSRESSSTLLARGVNGISTATKPLPRPATSTYRLRDVFEKARYNVAG